MKNRLKSILILILSVLCIIAVALFAGCGEEAGSNSNDGNGENNTEQGENEPHKHSYTSVITAPTCTKAGFTTYTCACGDSYVDDYVNATGHTPKAAVRENEVAASCKAEGSYDLVVRCLVCNEIISTIPKTTQKTAHAYVDGICSDCGNVDSSTHKHSYTSVVTAPTCTKAGFTTYTCTCGDSYVDDYVNATGHTPKAAVRENEVEATCTTDGGYDEVVYCNTCNEKISSTHKMVDATGHTPKAAVRENEVAATCTTQGSYEEVVRCNVCNNVISEERHVFEKLAHNYSNGICKSCGINIETEANLTTTDYVIDTSTSPATIKRTVSNATVNLDLVSAFTFSKGCTWKLYSDFLGEHESKFKAMTLDIGHNEAYIIVSYEQDPDYFTRYKLDVYRLDIKNYTFLNYDGTVHASGTIEEQSALVLPQTPIKQYYDFVEWNVKDISVTFPYTVYTDTTFTPTFIPTVYAITYELNGGTLETEVNDYDIEKSVTFDNAERTGYDFKGWYDNAEFNGVAVNGIVTGNHGNKTYYAKWTSVVYTITYVLNGGTLETEVNDYDIEKSVTFDEAERTGYDFKGWYDNAEFNGVAVNGIVTGNHGNKTYYAKWMPTVYTITYVLNGGTLETEVNDYDIEKSVTFDNAERTGYEFKGWYDNAEFNGEAITGLEIGNHGNKTYYAKWQIIKYSISYELNGGTLETEINGYDIEKTVTFDEAERIGYEFKGWYDNAQFNGEAVTGIAVNNYGNKIYYAKWTPHIYTITYELGGGEFITDYISNYCIETETIALVSPYKTDYTFMGWYSEDEQYITEISKGSYGNLNFIARWQYGTEGLHYTLNNESYTVSGYTGTAVSVTVPDTWNNLPVVSIGNSAFGGCYWLTSVIMPDSVTSLSESAFGGCSSLESITLPFVGNTLNGTSNTHFGYIFGASSYSDNPSCVPKSLKTVIIEGREASIGDYAFWGSELTSVIIGNGVTTIGGYAFCGCYSLTSIIIGNGVTTIGGYAFQGCSELTSVIIGNGVTTIGYGAFNGCSSLTSITIPDSVTTISGYAFRDCYSLESITIGNGVTLIGYGAFMGCSGLKSMTVPDSVITISERAFSDCSSLTSIIIGNSVTTIEKMVFYGCTSLESIFVSESNKKFYSIYNCIIEKETKTLITGCKNSIIPDGVTSIGDYAFWGCSGLTSITIPDSVTSIGDSAFYGCSSLKYNEYSNALYIGNSNNPYVVLVKAKNTDISECEIHNDTKFIHSYAFNGCSGLTTVMMPDSLTTIGNSAFGGSGLTSITIGNGVTSIGSYAFYNCSGLTNIYYNGDIVAWCGISGHENLMSYGASSKKLYLNGEEVTGELVIPDGVTTIPSYAFRNCSGLTSVTMPDSVTTIGYSAFRNCSSLMSITIPDSVTTIGYSAFRACSKLETVYWNATNCTNAGSISSPIFYNCTNLTDIIISENVETIPRYAFYNCSSLTSITIPDSVTSIGSYAFNGCSSLKTVYYKGTAQDWAKISIGSSNTPLTSATRYYYSETEPELNSDGTAYNGNYWHYNENGEVVVWKKEN